MAPTRALPKVGAMTRAGGEGGLVDGTMGVGRIGVGGGGGGETRGRLGEGVWGGGGECRGVGGWLPYDEAIS